MLRPESYDEEVSEVELIKTHISYVFLTGSYVYKVKKPVDLGFLDFTTLEKRKYFCWEELRVNEPLAGDIYIGVVPIVETEGGEIKVNARGMVIEYAVKMVQLPQSAIMSRLLEEGRVFAEDIEELAKLVARFHSVALTGEEIDCYGSFDQVKANWLQNFEQTRGLRGKYIDAEEYDELEGRVMRYLAERRGLFERRVEEGKIKECHGDLHSGNIFIARQPGGLYEEGIYIFDAIEFSRAFRNSDFLADAAFLAMDLDFFGREDLSSTFIKNYFSFSGEERQEELLNFYKCYRAYVRMKVTGFLFDESIEEREREQCEELVRSYFTLAFKYSKLF